jgi:hypothetical protein
MCNDTTVYSFAVLDAMLPYQHQSSSGYYDLNNAYATYYDDVISDDR